MTATGSQGHRDALPAASVSSGGTEVAHPKAPLGPWNPGITSTLPRRLYPLATVFSPVSSAMPVAEIESLAAFSGLPMQLVSELKPERLVLHEVLIRVMTELTIDDGPQQSDLGANFRSIINTLIQGHVSPLMPELLAAHRQNREAIERLVGDAVVCIASAPSRQPAARRSWRSFWRAPAPARTAPDPWHSDDATLHAIERWQIRSGGATTELERSVYAALLKAGTGIAAKQGSLVGRDAVLKRLATAIAVNDHAGVCLGGIIDQHFLRAVADAGLRLLPSQNRPIVMNTKGASAAGKSTLRPKQRVLAESIGVDWSDFAIISPDIWRKQLLDYGSLGSERRWAGTLTAFEVEIIDRKLDRYVASRAQSGRYTHMLIDRFRFDSFAPEGAEDAATQLLTRFAHEVYLFFMITPPEATVERAWHRGERVGRYKAVDDLLAHNIEAYTGMPALFFRWAASREKEVHYEFLDNSVVEGETPRTLAFGRNGQMVVVDVEGLCNIDRFRNIDVSATSPTEIYVVGPDPHAGTRFDFLRDCIRRIPEVVFADHATGAIYMRCLAGSVDYLDESLLATALPNAELGGFLRGCERRAGAGQDMRSLRLDERAYRTLGAWGSASSC